MSYFPSITLTPSNNGTSDAFDRLRVSQPYAIFDSKHLIDSGSILWAETASVGSKIEYTSSRASVKLKAFGTNGQVIRQTRQRFNYQPGKSQFVAQTFLFSSESAGVIKRLGYFDDNNGIFLEQSGTNINVVLRSSASLVVSESRISQSNWNIDTLTGTGASGQTIDFTKAQIFAADFEWLGVGIIRYGFFMASTLYYVHQITNQNALTSVYMSTPNLPLRYEITNTAGATTGTLEQICSTVVSEGGYEFGGILRAADTRDRSVEITASAYRPVVAIRYAAGKQFPSVSLTSIAVLNLSSSVSALRYSLLLNPSFSAAPTFQSIPNSAVEFATGSNQTIGSDGMKLLTGFAGTLDKNASSDLQSFIRLGCDITGSSDILCLAVQALTGSCNVAGSITYREST